MIFFQNVYVLILTFCQYRVHIKRSANICDGEWKAVFSKKFALLHICLPSFGYSSYLRIQYRVHNKRSANICDGEWKGSFLLKIALLHTCFSKNLFHFLPHVIKNFRIFDCVLYILCKGYSWCNMTLFSFRWVSYLMWRINQLFAIFLFPSRDEDIKNDVVWMLLWHYFWNGTDWF